MPQRYKDGSQVRTDLWKHTEKSGRSVLMVKLEFWWVWYVSGSGKWWKNNFDEMIGGGAGGRGFSGEMLSERRFIDHVSFF